MTNQSQPAKNPRSRGAVDVKMLELLVCPLTYGPLEFDAEKEEVTTAS